ncbi:hypothetical protein BDA96_10G328400 [Sorghum bicolor]|uniref:Uncharacterized protein n=2 Tax=Sorghum bicolor TaxID=4558 RepID=A0A921Q5N3_SORBI|nr:hypothetical protein BDA96_10G328400 [Sorghum bicolor]OQU77016.1 hypothetical protein SORBI_3010G253901 [Sorghum bicolor]
MCNRVPNGDDDCSGNYQTCLQNQSQVQLRALAFEVLLGSGKGWMKILGGNFSNIVISTKHPKAKQVQSSNGTSLSEACKRLTCGNNSSFYLYLL